MKRSHATSCTTLTRVFCIQTEDLMQVTPLGCRSLQQNHMKEVLSKMLFIKHINTSKM